MDKKTFLRFILISLAVTGIWFLVAGRLLPKPEPQLPKPAQVKQEGQPGVEVEKPVAGSGKPSVIEPAKPELEIAVAPDITLENELLSVKLTNKGAALRELDLLDYKSPHLTVKRGERPPALTLVKDFQNGLASDTLESLNFLPAGGNELEERIATADAVYKVAVASQNQAAFERPFGGRLNVRKTVSIQPDAHHYDVKLQFTNTTSSALKFYFRLRGAAGIERETVIGRDIGTVTGFAKGNGKYGVTLTPARKVEAKPGVNEAPSLLWTGVANQYFVAITRPLKPDWIKSVESEMVEDSDMLNAQGRWQQGSLSPGEEATRAKLARSDISATLQSTAVTLKPGQTSEFSYQFIAAPKLDRILSAYNEGMTDTLNFGWFPNVSRVMLAILKFFYYVIPNFGVAIILLTLVVKVVLHPLTVKSQMSMHRMQLLQPKLAELRKKHGDDRQKMATEQMQLFRTYGVHPMSGCLPMLLQMPIFFALFGTLGNAVELRQAVFIPGWVSDLSAPDTIYHLPFYMPFLGSAVNILPLLMVATSFISQHMTPLPEDPQARQQQKIMRWMPLIFAVMLYNFASGLLIYWTASSALGILEQWMIRKRLDRIELKPVAETQAKSGQRPGAPVQRKGFLDKLMAAVEKQSRRSQQARSPRDKNRK